MGWLAGRKLDWRSLGMVFDTFWTGSDGCSAGFEIFHKSLAVKSIGYGRHTRRALLDFLNRHGGVFVSLFDFCFPTFAFRPFKLVDLFSFLPSFVDCTFYLLPLSFIPNPGFASSGSSLRGIVFSGLVRWLRWRWWGLIMVSLAISALLFGWTKGAKGAV